MGPQRPVYSITAFTLLDFPGKTACILWFAGCNMRCPYCYNPEIVLGKGRKTLDEVLAFLRTRQGLLEGVVLSGGECTLHPGVTGLLRAIKRMGFAVKIDTNGSRPDTLKTLISQGLVDYLALDFKALPEKYQLLTGSHLFGSFERSLGLLLESDLPFEVRTTVHSELLNKQDLKNMTDYLIGKGYRGKYFLQQFRNNSHTLMPLESSLSIPEQVLQEIQATGNITLELR